MDFEIRSIRDGDEEQRHDLRRQAFGGADTFDDSMPLPSADRIVAAYAGDDLMGTTVTLDFEMSWSGALVPCGGVSGVVVRPEARGRGLARAMLAESFGRMAERGEVIAALYPTTATLYRSMGFEVCGSLDWRHVPLALVPTSADELTWRRVGFGDAAIRAVYDSMARTVDGWMVPDDLWWARSQQMREAETSKNRYAYVGSRGDADVAVVLYRYDSSKDRLYELAVEIIAGVDGDALASALAFLAGNGTTANYIETTLPLSVLGLHVPNVQHTAVTSDWPWMLRLVDAAGAVAARSWPTSVTGRVELDIADEVLPANAGPHVFEVDGAVGSLTPGGAGVVKVDVRDLAAIYAGADVGLLRAAGRLRGSTVADVDLLRAACVSVPSMSFFF